MFRRLNYLILVLAMVLGANVNGATEIWREAEAADSITEPMEIRDDATISGGQHIGVPSGGSSNAGPTTGIATYTFTAPAGVYKMICRVWKNGGNDSFWINISDSSSPQIGRADGWVKWNGLSENGIWFWDEVHDDLGGGNKPIVHFTLAGGTHTLQIARREKKTYLDAFVITDDLDLDPATLPDDISGLMILDTAIALYPASEATDVPQDAILSWTPAESADQHDVFFGSSFDDVNDATTIVDPNGVYKGRQSESTYDPGLLGLDETYYWRVDEISAAAGNEVLRGDVWEFATRDYIVVDDFEWYNDIPAGEEGSNLVYAAWVDGYDNDPSANGSTMGYLTAESLETGDVRSGDKSAPVTYDNRTAGVSEVVRTFTSAQDWTTDGVQTLFLWFYGDPMNVPGQLYVKINEVKVDYDGEADNLMVPLWHVWDINLPAVEVDLQNVTRLAIGVEGSAARGIFLLDDIRLHRQFQPDAGLVAHWPLNGDFSDASGNGHDGAVMGAPQIVVDGGRGSVMKVDGDDYIMIDDAPDLNYGANESLTVTAWALYDAPLGLGRWQAVLYKGRTGIGGDNSNDANRYGFSVDKAGMWRLNCGSVVARDVPLIAGEWQHLAFVQDAGRDRGTVYVDLQEVLSGSAGNCDTTGRPLFIGAAGMDTAPFEPFHGSISDVRIYNRALSNEELALVSE